MARIYSRGGAATLDRDDDGFESVHERERAPVLRTSARESRDAEIARDDMRVDRIGIPGINAAALEAPPPNPGMVQRWIADGSSGAEGQGATLDWLRKMREGWTPRKPDTIPKSMRHIYQSFKMTNGVEVIKVGSLVLCELPRQAAEQRRLAVADTIAKQRKMVPQSLQELRKKARSGGGPDMEITDDSERTFTGRRRAATMVD